MRRSILILLDRWAAEGPADLETVKLWKEELGWESWLPVAEAAQASGTSDLVELVLPELTALESDLLGLIHQSSPEERVDLMERLQVLIERSRDPEERDVALEGRLRMERGLIRFEEGAMDEAGADLEWAERRLRSVALASRDHDLSLLNRAAFHMAIGEHLMSLQIHSEISRHGGHAHETIALSRLQTCRIHLGLGHAHDALRHAWNAHAHALMAGMIPIGVEAGAALLEIGAWNLDAEHPRMADVAAHASPREVGDAPRLIGLHPADANGVLEWCLGHAGPPWDGAIRPDLRSLTETALLLGRKDLLETLPHDAIVDPVVIERLEQA